MDLLIRINNVNERDLAALMAAERVGCNFSEVVIVNEGTSVPCVDVESALCFYIKFWNTIKEILKL